MFTEIHIYYEGHALLKPGFSKFFSQLHDRAWKARCKFQLVTAGSGENACRDFDTSTRSNHHRWSILLKDSEGRDTGGLSESLCRDQGWPESRADSIFWMVEMMESWFHADKDALAAFYKEGFKATSLKRNPHVEQTPKADLIKGLKAATKNTKKGKGDYFDNKTSHGPKLLAAISPDMVQEAAPNCKRLFEIVLARLEDQMPTD